MKLDFIWLMNNLTEIKMKYIHTDRYDIQLIIYYPKLGKKQFKGLKLHRIHNLYA